MRTLHMLLLTTLVAHATSACAETTVSYDLNVRRFLGEESELAREKYFNIHTHPTYAVYSYEDIRNLKENYGVGFGRIFDGPFWYFAATNALEDAYPSGSQMESLSMAVRNLTETLPTYPLNDRRMVVTDHPYKAFHFDMDPVAAAQWAVRFFKHFYTDESRPLFYEPINEGFVHAKNYGKDEQAVRRKMAELYREIGKAFDESGLDVKVVGHASAWPELEHRDFWHWKSRMKMFMDVAGEHMDGLSVHLYDGINVTGQGNRRSGANADAILDLIETYSMIKWGVVKPHAITEYGDIPKGYGEDYTDVKVVQNHRAYNHLLFGLMERQDRLLQSIPFITGKSPWYYEESGKLIAYGWDLWKPDPDKIVNGKVLDYLFTPQLNFYKLWKGVQGERTVANSSNPDLQVRTFVNDTTAWICLNNLDDHPMNVRLEGSPIEVPLKSATIQRHNVQPRQPLIYSDTPLDGVQSQVELAPYETVLLCYIYEQPIVFVGQVKAETHYSPTYMQAIKKDHPVIFNFDGLQAVDMKATLRVSFGRDRKLSTQPKLKVNGTPVPMPTNWPGYDQENRTDFFGALPVPLDPALLKPQTTVELTFPDDGGHVSSVVLLTETSTQP